MKRVFLLAIFIAFWEPSFVVADYGKGVTIVRVSNNLDQGLNFSIHCRTNNNVDLGVQVVAHGYFDRIVVHRNVSHPKVLFCFINWRDGELAYYIYQETRDFPRRCTTDCNWEVNNNALIGVKQNYQAPDIIAKWLKPPLF